MNLVINRETLSLTWPPKLPKKTDFVKHRKKKLIRCEKM